MEKSLGIATPTFANTGPTECVITACHWSPMIPRIKRVMRSSICPFTRIYVNSLPNRHHHLKQALMEVVRCIPRPCRLSAPYLIESEFLAPVALIPHTLLVYVLLVNPVLLLFLANYFVQSITWRSQLPVSSTHSWAAGVKPEGNVSGGY